MKKTDKQGELDPSNLYIPDNGAALVASAFTPVLTAPAQDWLKAAALESEHKGVRLRLSSEPFPGGNQ